MDREGGRAGFLTFHSLEDRLVMTATANGRRSRVYGRVRNVDGVVFKQTHGTHKQFYTLVISLAGHEVDAIEPPSEFPMTVWAALADAGKLRREGKGFYSLVNELEEE